MRTALFFLSIAAAGLALTGCGGAPPAAKEAAPAAKPKPANLAHLLPAANQVSTEVVEDHLFGKTFLPGGTVGHYKEGKREYEMFITRLGSPDKAAFLLIDFKKALPDAKLIAHFGGYYGTDGARPYFIFTKNEYLTGIAGLDERDADAAARGLAVRIR
jgi:hypothetical protein